MYLSSDDRRPAITPQLAVRVAVIGGVALALFAVVFFRLWYLQVLSGDRHLAEANNNRLREIKVEAPRGEIVDREGRVLVENRQSVAIRLAPDKLPRRQHVKTRLYRRLGRVLDMDPREIRTSVREQLAAEPYATATVKSDSSRAEYVYILEHKQDFPGVNPESLFLRSYTRRQVGAHLFGTVGEVGKEALEQDTYSGAKLGDRVGTSGIELAYDRFLRGQNGARRVSVTAFGQFDDRLNTREPRQGRQLRLNVDLDVQRVGQQALAGSRGAFVVMDVRSGAVHALGSTPSFDPNRFAEVIREKDFRALSSKENGEPLVNRATQSAYVTGSTFKVVTAAAALEGGLITPGTTIFDGGSLKVGDVLFETPGNVAHGSVAIREALKVSSDVFFYVLGRDMDSAGDGDLLQRWARRLGLGRKTGIDLPAEAEGLVPSREWRNREFARYQRCRRRTPAIKLAEDPFFCGVVDRPWSTGDNVNLAIGQSDLAASPLQLAVAYAAIANGGYLVTPRLGQRIEDADGRVRQELEPGGRRRVKISAAHRRAILDGLRQSTSAPGGTSTDVFQDFPIQIAGKTGTAEKGGGRADQSWYVALAPYPDPKYVVAVTDEAGGFGAERAAPVARRILAALYQLKGDTRKVVKGSSRTR